MTKIDLNKVEIVFDTSSHDLEFRSKTDKKIIGYVSLSDNGFLKAKDDLTFWDKFCRWTLGLFGKKWDDVEVIQNGQTNNKTYCVYKKGLPDIEALSHKKTPSPQVYSARTHRSKFASEDQAPKTRQEASSLRSKTSKFAQAAKVAPAPFEKPVIPKNMLTEKKIKEANDFLSLRNLIIDVCNLDKTCKESDLLNALDSKVKASLFKTRDEKFNWEALQMKYENLAIPELDCAISVINEKINSRDGQEIHDLICDILKIPHDVDEETFKGSIKDMQARIDSFDATKRPAAFYHFKNLIAAKRELYKPVLKQKITIPLLNVTESEIKRAKSSDEKRDLLCKILDLPKDSARETIRKAALKKFREIAPDKVQQRSGSQAEIEAATEAFKYFKPLFDSLGK